jgi:hypothetical protein
MAKIVGYEQAPSFIAQMQRQSLFGLSAFGAWSSDDYDALTSRAYAVEAEAKTYASQAAVASMAQAVMQKGAALRAWIDGLSSFEKSSYGPSSVQQDAVAKRDDLEASLSALKEAARAASQPVPATPVTPDIMPECPTNQAPFRDPVRGWVCVDTSSGKTTGTSPDGTVALGERAQVMLAIYNQNVNPGALGNFGTPNSGDADGVWGGRSKKAWNDWRFTFCPKSAAGSDADAMKELARLVDNHPAMHSDVQYEAMRNQIGPKRTTPQPPPPVMKCPAGTTGTPPNCKPVAPPPSHDEDGLSTASMLTYGLIGLGAIVLVAALAKSAPADGRSAQAAKPNRRRYRR